jgi:FixJ family two-component response regulator
MQSDGLTIYIVEDDASVRDALGLMLGLIGYRTVFFADAEAFLAAWQENWAGCVIADLKLPGQSGIELQGELQRRGDRLPFIIITAHGDVAAARTAFRADAVDFLEKPFDHAQLRSAIQTAFSRETRRLRRSIESERLTLLTSREREVLEHAAKGLHAKEIGRALGISVRTVEVHKTRLMAKLGVRNVGELVRFAMAAQPPQDIE